MTVAELIKVLSMAPGNQKVLVEGYEGGLSELRIKQNVLIKLNVHKEDYMGPHEKAEDGTEKALVFYRAQNENSGN